MIDTIPAEIFQQTAKTAFHSGKIEVMAKPCLGPDSRDPRLPGINFPWVEVKNRRLSIDAVYPPNCPT